MADEILPRGEQTRRQITQAAHELFLKQGYHGTSMRQVAKHAEVALGGLYNHFESKEDVFKAVLLEYHPYHQVLPVLMEAKGETIEEVVSDAAAQMLKSLKERPQFLNLMFIELVEFKSAHAGELIISLLPQISQAVEHMLSCRGNRLRPIPTVILARTFIGLFFSYYLTEMMIANSPSPEFRQDAMRYFVDIYLHGILAEDQP